MIRQSFPPPNIRSIRYWSYFYMNHWVNHIANSRIFIHAKVCQIDVLYHNYILHYVSSELDSTMISTDESLSLSVV